jgi:hypothetical protein
MAQANETKRKITTENAGDAYEVARASKMAAEAAIAQFRAMQAQKDFNAKWIMRDKVTGALLAAITEISSKYEELSDAITVPAAAELVATINNEWEKLLDELKIS